VQRRNQREPPINETDKQKNEFVLFFLIRVSPVFHPWLKSLLSAKIRNISSADRVQAASVRRDVAVTYPSA